MGGENLEFVFIRHNLLKGGHDGIRRRLKGGWKGAFGRAIDSAPNFDRPREPSTLAAFAFL